MIHKYCTARHTKYQPEEWRCPQCGATEDDGDGFLIDSPALEALDECEGLHINDEVYCQRCGYSAMGSAAARKMQAKENRVPCSCCNGSGWVKKPTGEPK